MPAAHPCPAPASRLPAFPATLALLLTLLGLLPLAGCSANTVPAKFRPEAKLEAWSDDDWAYVLDRVVTDDGFVRHDLLAKNEDGVRDALYRYVGQIGAASPENRPHLFPAEEDRLAYYLNAYNALAMYGVEQRGFPSNVLTANPLAPGALFFLDRFRVGGGRTNLDTLEKKHVLAASGHDPRMHFALNCMSYSCPPLRAEPFAGDRLDTQLDDQGRRYLSDVRAVRKVDDATVELNSIFTSYYERDFENYAREEIGKDAGVLDALRRFAAEGSPVRSATSYRRMGYDWSLNTPPAGE